MTLRRTLVVAGALVLASCTSGASAGQNSGEGSIGIDVPLPTIGLGSDTGSGGGAGADPDAIERIVMIGDSITVGATPHLVERFESAGLPADISAEQGKRIDVNAGSNLAGTRIAEGLAAGAGAGDDVAWVVALGTNDIGQYGDQADVEQEIRDLLAVVPPQAPVIWINTWFRDRPDGTAMVNAAIERVLGARGNATIGDWSSLAPAEGVLRSDGVHPNDTGAQVFADLVVGTVRDFLQR